MEHTCRALFIMLCQGSIGTCAVLWSYRYWHTSSIACSVIILLSISSARKRYIYMYAANCISANSDRFHITGILNEDFNCRNSGYVSRLLQLFYVLASLNGYVQILFNEYYATNNCNNINF